MAGGEVVGYRYIAGTKDKLRQAFDEYLVEYGLKQLKTGMTRSDATDELLSLGWTQDYADTFIQIAFEKCN